MTSDNVLPPNQLKPVENQSAVVVNSRIFKLVETIQRKIKAGHTDKDLEDLKQLRDLCGSDSPLVSVSACHGLVSLVKASVCPLPNTVSALVASLFSVQSVVGVTSALTQLMVLELRSQLITDSVYTSALSGGRGSQHPLVAVLKRRPTAWADVLNHVQSICEHPDKQVRSHSLDLVKPVLMYTLMEPNDLPASARLQAFRITSDYFSNTDFLLDALASSMCWDDSRLLELVQLVAALAQSAVSSKHGQLVSVSCLALASLVPRLLQSAVSPQPTIQLLSRLAVLATNTHSTLLALLADSIPLCPAVYLEYLLGFFVELLSRGQCSLDVTWMCVAGLMPWLTSSPAQLSKALHTATLIVSHANAASANACTTATLISDPAVSAVISADARLTQAIYIARLSERLRGNTEATLAWLESLPLLELDTVHQYVSALLISRREVEVRSAALQTLVTSQAPAASHNLTVLLYQLAREQSPEMQLALLRALPSTAVEKNNVVGVISTLEALRRSGHQTLSLLSIDLYSQLWMNQERCYPQLMDVLNQDCSHFREPWLAYTLQASICKAICDAKPEMHGKEVVAKVSELLNKCAGVKEAAAAALALQALIPLCSHDVVDVFTIWRNLAPRFSRDRRTPVLKSLCELVSVGAVQKSAVAGADDALAQMLKWLWSLVAVSKNTEVVEAALKALSKFRLDQMNLKMLPECFRKDLRLPVEMAKTPVDAARKPEDVLNYIPGECWIQVLSHLGSEATSQALASWVRMEVVSFRGPSLYQVDRQEPSSYSHLPHSSIVRGVTTSLQHLSPPSTPQDCRLVTLCLSALSRPSPKPLPSLSWGFLRDITDPSLEHDVVRLAAKQAPISPSARKITENFIANVGTDKEKIKFLFSILSDLCRGIPPNTLRPFFEKNLQSALNQKDKEQFSVMMESIGGALKEEKIHDANRNLLQQQLKALWDVMEAQGELLSIYFGCVSEMPVSVVESMTSTSLMWEVTSAQLQKSFQLRSFMALLPHANLPLNWLNEIIEVASSNISEQALAVQLVTRVISALRRHSSAWPWLQELMGQTHLSCSANKGGVECLVTVFVLCVDIMSGYSSLACTEDSAALRFPQAITSLVSRHGDAKSMLEWLNHMRGVDSFPSQYTVQFEQAARNVSLILNQSKS